MTFGFVFKILHLVTKFFFKNAWVEFGNQEDRKYTFDKQKMISI